LQVPPTRCKNQPLGGSSARNKAAKPARSGTWRFFPGLRPCPLLRTASDRHKNFMVPIHQKKRRSPEIREHQHAPSMRECVRVLGKKSASRKSQKPLEPKPRATNMEEKCRSRGKCKKCFKKSKTAEKKQISTPKQSRTNSAASFCFSVKPF